MPNTNIFRIERNEELKSFAKAKLRELGFSASEISMLVEQSGFLKASKTLIDWYPALRDIFDHQQIVSMVSYGGLPSVKFIISIAPQLIQLGYNNDDIVKLVKHRGATNTIRIVIAETNRLLTRGFSHKQIVELASYQYGPLTKVSLAIQYSANEALSVADILTLIYRRKTKPSANDMPEKTNAPEDLTEIDDDVQVVSIDSDSEETAVPEPKRARQDHASTPPTNEVRAMPSKKTRENQKADGKARLLLLGFKQAEVDMLSEQIGFIKLSELLTSIYPELIKIFNHTQIVKIAGSGGLHSLSALVKHASTLLTLGYSAMEIESFSTHFGASQTLEILVAETNNLLNRGFTREQIMNLVKRSNGSSALKLAIRYSKDQQRPVVDIIDTLLDRVARTGTFFETPEAANKPDDMRMIDDQPDEIIIDSSTATVQAPQAKRARLETAPTAAERPVITAPSISPIPKQTTRPRGALFYLPVTLSPCGHTVEAELCTGPSCKNCHAPITQRTVDLEKLNRIKARLAKDPALLASQYCTPTLIHDEIRSNLDNDRIIQVAVARGFNNLLAAEFDARGRSFTIIGNLEQGIMDANKAVFYAPTVPYYYSNRSITNYKLGRWSDALLDIDKAIELNNSNPQAYILRARIYMQLDKKAEALHDLETAYNLNPREQQALLGRILALTRELRPPMREPQSLERVVIDLEGGPSRMFHQPQTPVNSGQPNQERTTRLAKK